MKIIYTILFFLNATALTGMLLFLFNEVDNHAGILPISGILLVVVFLIILLFHFASRYFKVPVRDHTK